MLALDSMFTLGVFANIKLLNKMSKLIINHSEEERKLPVLFKKAFSKKQLGYFLRYSDFDKTLVGKWTSRISTAAFKGYVRVKYYLYRVVLKIHSKLFVVIFRVAVLVLVFFIYNQKEIQFSIDLNAPGISFHTQPRLESAFPNVKMVSYKTTTPIVVHDIKKVEDLNEIDVQSYIKRFSKVASVEMEKFGIPASFKMALAILESRAGTDPKATSINNHFGDNLDGEFYQSAWKNWRAHSEFLKRHFSFLFNNGMNYKKWSEAIQNSDYTTDDQYGQKILDIIENYQLYLLDEV